MTNVFRNLKVNKNVVGTVAGVVASVAVVAILKRAGKLAKDKREVRVTKEEPIENVEYDVQEDQSTED